MFLSIWVLNLTIVRTIKYSTFNSFQCKNTESRSVSRNRSSPFLQPTHNRIFKHQLTVYPLNCLCRVLLDGLGDLHTTISVSVPSLIGVWWQLTGVLEVLNLPENANIFLNDCILCDSSRVFYYGLSCYLTQGL